MWMSEENAQFAFTRLVCLTVGSSLSRRRRCGRRSSHRRLAAQLDAGCSQNPGVEEDVARVPSHEGFVGERRNEGIRLSEGGSQNRATKEQLGKKNESSFDR